MKEQFIKIYKENIRRPGAEKLLAWLENSDFFEAPASTRFHLCRPGGLVEHSVHVYKRLLKLYKAEKTDPAIQELHISRQLRKWSPLPSAACCTTFVRQTSTPWK